MRANMLKNKHQDFKLVLYPKMRRVLNAMLSMVQHKHMMHGFVEMDVTNANQYIREYLSMTISVDHDVIDGAPATRFALRLKELVESGYGLIDQFSPARRNNSVLQA